MKQKFDNSKISKKGFKPIEADLIENEEGAQESRLQEFIKTNSTIIIVASIVLIGVIAIFLYLRSSQETDAQQASVALSRIVNYINTGDYETALNGNPTLRVRGEEVIGLKQIVSMYDGTSPGKVAAVFAGNALLEMNKIEEAREYFENATSSDSKVIQVGAYAGLGAYYELKGNFSEAGNSYMKAAELTDEAGSKSRYSYYAGASYEKSGDKDKAEKIFRDIIAENEYSEFSGKAKSGLVRLGMIIE